MTYDPLDDPVASPWDSGAPAPRRPRPDFLERLALALSQAQAPPPGGRAGDEFGANLLTGLAHGFSAPRVQGMQDKEAEYQRRLKTYQQGQDDQHDLDLYGKKERIRQSTEAEFRAPPTPIRPAPTPQQIEDEAFHRARGAARGNPPDPKEADLTPVTGPDGVVRWGPKVKGQPIPPPVTTRQTRQPTGGERLQLSGDIGILESVNNIRTTFSPKFVGPLKGRVGGVQQKTGLGLDKGEGQFRSTVAGLRNTVLKLRSGGAVTDGEAARLLEEIPVVTDPSEVFKDKLNQFEHVYRTVASAHRDIISGTGVDLSKIPALPSSTPGELRPTHVYDPATGTIKPVGR